MLSKGVCNEKHFRLTCLGIAVVFIIIPLRSAPLLLVFNLRPLIVSIYKTAQDEVTLNVIRYLIKIQTLVGEIKGCIEGRIV